MKKTPAKLTAAFAAGIGLVALTCSEYQSQAQTQAPAPSVAPAAEQSETTDFVRFAEGQGEGGGDQLQTVVRSYRRGNTQVDLVAVIHIADPDYYDAMNERLGNYDVVLYEMVGGPFEKRDLQAAEADSSMAGVRVVHSLLQNLLALEYQTEGIDYDNDHFVHADVDWNEYSELMTERNQSMATLFQRAMAISLSGETVPGLPNGDAENVVTNFGFTRSRFLIGLFRRLEDSCLTHADAVITISPALAEHALERVADPAHHFLIENSIFEPVRLQLPTIRHEPSDCLDQVPQDRVVICYAGTFEEYQGIDLLLPAFALARQRHPELYLVLAGGTEVQVELYRGLARREGVDRHCLFCGSLSQPNAQALVQLADVLVSPRSRGTNTPLKIYELLASGKPFVATRIPSHTQVLSENVCFLADPAPQSISDAIVEAARGSGTVERVVRAARALYEQRYSRQIYEEKMGRLLEVLR